MAIALPPELEDLSLRERRRRFEERTNGTAEADQVACSVCAGPIEPARVKAGARTCAQESCRHEARLRRRRAARDSNGNGSHAAPALAAQETPEEVAATIRPSMPISATNSASPGSTNSLPRTGTPAGASPLLPSAFGAMTSHPAGTDRLFHALMVAGATLSRVEVVVGGECWTVTRTTTNGAP